MGEASRDGAGEEQDEKIDGAVKLPARDGNGEPGSETVELTKWHQNGGNSSRDDEGKQRSPDEDLCRVLVPSGHGLEGEVLLELFECELDLPAKAVELGNRLTTPNVVDIGQVVERPDDGSAPGASPSVYSDALAPGTNHQPHGNERAIFSAASDSHTYIEIPCSLDVRAPAQKLSKPDAVRSLGNELPDSLRPCPDFVHDGVAVETHRRDELQLSLDELLELSSSGVGVVEQQE